MGGEGGIQPHVPGYYPDKTLSRRPRSNHFGTSPWRECSPSRGTSLSILLNIVAPIPEEVLHQLATIVLQDARDDGQPVRDPYALQIQNGFHRTKFGLRRPINQGAHPGVNDGADAHQARLHRHVKREASKAIVATA